MPTKGDFPGLKRRLRPDGRLLLHWVASQIARDVKGFTPKTRLLWNAAAEPSPQELELIRQECVQLCGHLRAWQASGRVAKLRARFVLGHVYFIRRGDLVKIGFTRSLSKRLKAIQQASAKPSVLLGSVNTTAAVERHLHHRFRRLRVRGEWFRLEKPILDFISDETQPASQANAA